MEWIQLLLPAGGQREALLRCLTGCSLDGCHLDREAIEQDFSGWLQQRRDEAARPFGRAAVAVPGGDTGG